MKAIVHDRYGSPDVLHLRDVDIPSIDDDGVLIEVHASSVNALDWHCTRGKPYIMRLDGSFRTPRPKVRGVDLAGRVVAVGKNVTRFQPDDDVFGASDSSFAEYAATTSQRISHKPLGLTYEQAATLNVAGLTALQGLRDKGQLRAGHKLLIIGAGGGVGTFAVQLGKWMGAHVTAVTRTESVDVVRSIGADEVIDHRVEDFTRLRERYDVVLDIGGSRPFVRCLRVLNSDGVLVVVGGPAGRWLAPADRMLKAMVLDRFVRQRVIPLVCKTDDAGRTLLAELTLAGTLSPVIDRQYALADTREAVRYLGSSYPRGKVVIKVR
jgi:NADPH:quinone reductase-like Zn-dependent oxidoreductase